MILIKGMEMPTSCSECQKVIGCCEHNEDGTVWCRLAKSYIGETVCPLIELQSHGRLIDADALIKRLNNERELAAVFGGEIAETVNDMCDSMIREIELMPIVVHADQGW